MSAPLEIVVIGAGILGAAAAHHLARRGARITVVDAPNHAPRATAASFACINASAKTEPALAALNDRAVEEHHRVAHELGAAATRFTGQHYIAHTAESLHIALTRVHAAIERGYGGEMISRHELKIREPNYRLDHDPAGIAWFPADGWTNPESLRAHYLKGLDIRHDMVKSVLRNSTGRLRVVTASGDHWDVDRVINAAGAGANDIMLPSAHTRVVATTGFVVSASVDAHLVSSVIRTENLGIRPDGPGRLIIHSHDIDKLLGRDRITIEQAADVLLMRARNAVSNASRITTRSMTIGPRPTPRDGLPSVGESALLGGYYELAAHSGLTLAPLLGRLIATEVLDDVTDPVLVPFHPRHLPIG